jgi:hypothetical protein
MKNFDSRTYSINDFREWDEAGDQLILAPKFQRRNIWTDKARSYLMDTIIRGKPIPKIFIRQDINPKSKKTIREVVDGQQRLRTILGYLKDGFAIGKVHNETYGGKQFSQLPDNIQSAILKYELSVDLLLDATDKEVLDIFARLNTYSVKLVRQELINAKYFGEFKQTVYELALEYLTFWQSNKIFSDAKILRMAEAELTSELLIAMSEGIKSKKVIETYYKKYEDSFPNRKNMMERFRKIMDVIGEMMSDRLSTSNFRRHHMFYTLFCSIYHMLFGMTELEVDRISFKQSDYPKINLALEKVEEIFEKDDLTKEERKFLDATRRATTDASVRKSRSEYVCALMVKAFQS